MWPRGSVGALPAGPSWWNQLAGGEGFTAGKTASASMSSWSPAKSRAMAAAACSRSFGGASGRSRARSAFSPAGDAMLVNSLAPT